MNPRPACGYCVRWAAHPDAPCWYLRPGRHCLGRGADCDVRIDECTISRRHAEVEVLPDGGLVVRDLGSLNGCWLGRRRVHHAALTGEFDLQLGAVLLEFDALGAGADEIGDAVDPAAIGHRRTRAERAVRHIDPAPSASAD